MNRALLIFALLGTLLLDSAWAQQLSSADIVGKYQIVKGVNPDGSTYDGSLTVKSDASGGVTVTWDDGSVGLGMIEGNRLYIGLVFEKRSMVMALTFNKDGTATGKWILRTESGVGIENWKRR